MTPTPTPDTPAMTEIAEDGLSYRITDDGDLQIPGSETPDGWATVAGNDPWSYEDHETIMDYLREQREGRQQACHHDRTRRLYEQRPPSEGRKLVGVARKCEDCGALLTD